MSAQAQVQWLKLPIVGCPGTECQIPTTPDGRTLDHEGEPIPHAQRTHVCNGESRWMLGNVFLCQAHAAEVARMMDDSIEAVEAAWREQL